MSHIENNEKIAQAFEQEDSSASRKKVPHSRLGIFSTLLALICGIALVILTSTIYQSLLDSLDTATGQSGNPLLSEDDLIGQLMPLIRYFAIYPLILVFVLIGFVLGLIGWSRNYTKKLFGVIGTIANGVILLAVTVLLILGMFFS